MLDTRYHLLPVVLDCLLYFQSSQQRGLFGSGSEGPEDHDLKRELTFQPTFLR